jgi:hypothetical protein
MPAAGRLSVVILGILQNQGHASSIAVDTVKPPATAFHWRKEAMTKNFTSQKDFLGAVAESLEQSECASDIQQAILNGVGEADNQLAAWEDQGNSGQELRMGRWFIRNDDFPFIQLLGSIASGVALLATGGVAAGALVGPVSSFAAACWQIRRKGATLTPEQVAAFGVLTAGQGATVEQLEQRLTEIGRAQSGKKLLATLQSLLAVELYDGSVVALVRCDDEKKWRALHV